MRMRAGIRGEGVRKQVTFMSLLLAVGIFGLVQLVDPPKPPPPAPPERLYYGRQGLYELLDVLLVSKDFQTKRETALLVWQIGDLRTWRDDDGLLIDKVEALMLDENAWVRNAMAHIVLAIGDPARHTLPTLIKALAMGERGRFLPNSGGHPTTGPALHSTILLTILHLANVEGWSDADYARRCRSLRDETGDICKRDRRPTGLPNGIPADRAGMNLLIDQITLSTDAGFRASTAGYLPWAAKQIEWSDEDWPLIDKLERLMLDGVADVRAGSILAAKAIGLPARQTSATMRRAVALGSTGKIMSNRGWRLPGATTASTIASAIWSLEESDVLSGVEKAARCAEFSADIQPLTCFPELEGVLP